MQIESSPRRIRKEGRVKTFREEIREIISEIAPCVESIREWADKPGNMDPFGIAAIVAVHMAEIHRKYAMRLQSALDRTKEQP